MLTIGNIDADIKAAFPNRNIPCRNSYYESVIQRCANIYQNEPEWKNIKKSGLYGRGTRDRAALNTAKVLCDELSALSFSEKTRICVSVKGDEAASEALQRYVDTCLDGNGFWRLMPEWLAHSYALGGGVLKVYAKDGLPTMDYITADSFYPEKYSNRRITAGFFRSKHIRGQKYYTLIENYGVDKAGAYAHSKLFRSGTEDAIGSEVPLSELFGEDIPSRVDYGGIMSPMFVYFRPACANNLDMGSCLGISVFANACDTLKTLDIAFDSFSREFILGRKRIIVPSSCIRTVVDPDTGNICRYFDADDEVYQALKCDEERDLKISDNTCELRVQEHVDSINALLDILCFQAGLSAGFLSFEKGGLKTATEVISENSKTYRTMTAHKNLLSEALIGAVRCMIDLGKWLKICSAPEDYEVTVSFADNIIEDDNTIADRNIALVTAGLKSKLSAVMEVLKCDEETAKKELERIREENGMEISSEGENFAPSKK